MTETIDAHVHYWQVSRGDYARLTPGLPIHRDFLPADGEPLFDAAGIDGIVLVQAADTEAETRFMLSLARADPRVRGVVGWTDMEVPDAPDRLAALAGDPLLRGIRPMWQDIPEDGWFLRSQQVVRMVLERCTQWFLAILGGTWSWVKWSGDRPNSTKRFQHKPRRTSLPLRRWSCLGGGSSSVDGALAISRGGRPTYVSRASQRRSRRATSWRHVRRHGAKPAAAKCRRASNPRDPYTTAPAPIDSKRTRPVRARTRSCHLPAAERPGRGQHPQVLDGDQPRRSLEQQARHGRVRLRDQPAGGHDARHHRGRGRDAGTPPKAA